MKTEWGITSLEEILDELIDYRGKTPKKLGGDWGESGYKAISANNVKFSGLVNTETIRYVNHEIYKKWMKSEVRCGDLLLTSEAPSGQVMYWDSDEKIVLSQRLYGLRIKKDFCPKFIKYYLQSALGQKEIFKNNSGSTVAGISAKTFKNIMVRHPLEYKHQEEIGEILYNIDKKISINNSIIEELEDSVENYFQRWFLQFEFPSENQMFYKKEGGEFVFCEHLHQDIPKGWSTEELKDVVSDIIDHRGKTPKKLGGDWTDDVDGILALSAKLIKDGRLVNIEKANKVSKELYTKWMKEELCDGDVIMTSEAPAGEFFYVHGFNKYCMSQRVFAIRANKKKVMSTYMYCQLRFGHTFSQIQSNLSGSTVAGIRQDVLKKLKFLTPDLKVQSSFNEIVSPKLATIRSLEREIFRLNEIRDWLIPFLIYGQVSSK
ncbi:MULTISPECIES: restriction endonuclease subunit S [unclassified Halobacteriovorax]|uniref:restriction endonuclease subunit S n=1 Tax=unclassified Halobacteriovorax TaxID=2639665 RepID=UPI00399BB260